LRRNKERELYEEQQRAKGLIEYKGKWGTPQQVEQWKREDEKKISQLKTIRKAPKSWASITPKEVKTQEKEIEWINCSFCKTKFNLMQRSTCPHCGAPYRN